MFLTIVQIDFVHLLTTYLSLFLFLRSVLLFFWLVLLLWLLLPFLLFFLWLLLLFSLSLFFLFYVCSCLLFLPFHVSVCWDQSQLDTNNLRILMFGTKQEHDWPSPQWLRPSDSCGRSSLLVEELKIPCGAPEPSKARACKTSIYLKRVVCLWFSWIDQEWELLKMKVILIHWVSVSQGFTFDSCPDDPLTWDVGS